MDIVFDQYPGDRILNADETSWKIINNRMVTVADYGAEAVPCKFDGEAKGCTTALATIDAAGRKLPLWVICGGAPVRCEADLRRDFAFDICAARLVVTHEANG
jgi:hypothetical protein